MPHRVTGYGLFTLHAEGKRDGDSISKIVTRAGYFRESDPSKLAFTAFYEALINARNALGVGPIISPEELRKNAALDALDKFLTERDLFQYMHFDLYECMVQFMFSNDINPSNFDERYVGMHHTIAEFALNYAIQSESYNNIPDYIKHSVDWTKAANQLLTDYAYWETPSMVLIFNA